MNRRTCSTGKPAQRQRGAALIVALIMLLLLTIIGVAGMRDNQLQEKMTGSSEDRAEAFQAAEAALRAGEAEVQGSNGTYTGSCSVGTCYWDYQTNGYTSSSLMRTTGRNCSSTNSTCTEAAFWAQYAWTTSTNSKVYAGTGLTEVASQPRYVIERLPQSYSTVPSTLNANSSLGSSAKTIQDFLITARGTGRSSNAVVILQSMYRDYY